jgi:hypothetical protein
VYVYEYYYSGCSWQLKVAARWWLGLVNTVNDGCKTKAILNYDVYVLNVGRRM